ncbi:hypothetical protein [Hyphomicrobium sp.]|uniref:hypothetical protein n=1 Tax=Hyphomicrobium sp. TaxID=82 RepID=UPI0025C4ACDB|nr:hypothetical protein [Hyphomicrobium sp.]MCC7251628.1 hypothetical protein [Hyphomicrobium sp.]
MMDHVQSDLSQRFAKSYATAAFGYVQAASAAYAALADQTLDFWSRAARSGAQDDERPPRLQLVSGPRPYRSAVTGPTHSVTTGMPIDFIRMSNAWANSPMFAPMRAWWGLFPLQGNPASWPMAYAMMTAGVPRAVALPTAEANVAAMDAAEAATTSFNRVLSSYRSDSGFAVAQIISPKTWLGAMLLAPFTTSFKLPWA